MRRRQKQQQPPTNPCKNKRRAILKLVAAAFGVLLPIIVAPLSTIFPMSFLHAVIVTTHTHPQVHSLRYGCSSGSVSTRRCNCAGIMPCCWKKKPCSSSQSLVPLQPPPQVLLTSKGVLLCSVCHQAKVSS